MEIIHVKHTLNRNLNFEIVQITSKLNASRRRR